MNNLLVAVLGLSLLSTPSVKKDKEKEATPTFIQDENQYFYGNIAGEEVFSDDEDFVYTAIVVHPLGESDMYNFQLTFCGNQMAKFKGVHDTGQKVALIYSKNTSKSCYRLELVEVVDKSHDGSESIETEED